MKTKLKAVICIFTGVCIISALFCGCTGAGTERGPSDGTGGPVGFTATQPTGGLGMTGPAGTDDFAGITDRTGTTGSLGGANTSQTGATAGSGTSGGATGSGVTGGTGEAGRRGGTGAAGGTSGAGGTVGNMAGADNQKADNLKRQLEKMSGVRNVDVIVVGNSALVGVEASGQSGGISGIRDSIGKKVKEIDKTIIDVAVTDSTNIVSKLKRLITDSTGAAS